MTLLHAHPSNSGFSFDSFADEVLVHGILDTLKIIPFLFLTYLFMEFIEHKASNKFRGAMEKSGPLSPAISGLLGTIPQCGFSASVANFYTGGIVTVGALVAVFLSTSDEMIPILISGKVSVGAIFAILGYKLAVSIVVGFSIDFILRLMKCEKRKINIEELCQDENCHCQEGMLLSSIHHTVTISGFLLVVTLLINTLVYFIGSDSIAAIFYDKPIISHIIAALIGLIPNCAISVALTNFCIEGFITVGTMLSGLFSGAGIGLLVLFKVNKNLRENLLITAILVSCGVVFGFLADVLNFSKLLV